MSPSPARCLAAVGHVNLKHYVSFSCQVFIVLGVCKVVWDIKVLSFNLLWEVMMKDYVKYGRARDQLYHYKVAIRQTHEAIPTKRRTTELVQLLEMVEALVDTVCTALENNQIVGMQLDCYELVPLPGFEDLMSDNENPYRDDKG